MPGLHGNPVARTVRNGLCKVGPGAWTQLTSSQLGGNVVRTNLADRQWLQLQVRGASALCLTYTCRSLDGASYATTVPAYNAQVAKIIPANTIWQEPLSDDVMLWGRSIVKAGASNQGGLKVIVTEYA